MRLSVLIFAALVIWGCHSPPEQSSRIAAAPDTVRIERIIERVAEVPVSGQPSLTLGGCEEVYGPGDYVTVIAAFNDTTGMQIEAVTACSLRVYYPNSGTPTYYAAASGVMAELDDTYLVGVWQKSFQLPAYNVQYDGSWAIVVWGTVQGKIPQAATGFAYTKKITKHMLDF